MLNTYQELETQLSALHNVTEQIDLLNLSAWRLWGYDPARARRLAQRAHGLACSGEFAESPYQKGRLESLLNMASIDYNQSHYDQALAQASALLIECVQLQLPELRPMGLMIVNMCYLRTGVLTEALNGLQEALELSKNASNLLITADLLSAIAIVHVFRGEHAIGLDYFQQSEVIYHQIDDQLGLGKALMNQCMSHKDLKDYTRSLACGFQALAIWRALHHHRYELMTLSNLGNTYLAMGDFSEALHYYLPSVALVDEVDAPFMQIYALLNLGRAYLSQKQPIEAGHNLRRALSIAEATNQQGFQFECHELLAGVYKAEGQFEQALFHHERFHVIKSAVFSERAETKQKTIETKNAELAKEIAERKLVEAALVAAKQQAESANQAKTDFLSNMSHELRTPLNAILGFSELIAHRNELDPELREAVHIIQQSGRHLLTLISNVLNVAKIEAGKMTLQEHEFSLQRLLDDTLDMFQLKAAQKKLHLHLQRADDMPESLYGDENKLRQILINLVGNALKFTTHGSVNLRVSCQLLQSAVHTTKTVHATEDAAMVTASPAYLLQIVIEDTGVGIAPEEMSLLFTPFYQAQAGRLAQEGTGLGLALGQRFAALMGGTITVKSEIGQGSTFCLAVHLASPPTGPFLPLKSKQPVIGLQPGQPSYRILVVDDNVVARKLLTTILNKVGFEVNTATNGEEAIQRWQAWHPHLIWMDVSMPVMNGHEATRIIKAKVKEMPATVPKTIIIALTAGSFEEDHIAAIIAGCDDYLRKPYQAHAIMDAMRRWLGIQYIYAPSVEA